MVWNEILVNGLVVGLPGDFHGLIVAKWSCGQKCEMVYCFWDCLMEMTFLTGHTCPVFGFISAQWPLNVSTWGNKVFFLSLSFFCSLDSEGYPGLGWLHGASCHACIGGTNVRNEMQKLQAEAPHIVVGTPGRVFDMLNRRYLCK